jgi:SAM-dependent methyltransferase
VGAVVLRETARRILSDDARRRLRKLRAWPPVGSLRLGSLRRVTPISGNYGFDRGTPVDRYYIDRFLTRHARDVRGRVLEVGDAAYTRGFGGERVESVDVLHVEEGNPEATIVADLADAPQIPDGRFDCVICTQTLLLVYDVQAAVRTLHRILRPGGVVLATVPGVSRICREEAEAWGDFWRFTSMSAQRLFEEPFGSGAVQVEAYGNVLAAVGMLHGIAAEELGARGLDSRDRDYEVLIGVRAERRG